MNLFEGEDSLNNHIGNDFLINYLNNDNINIGFKNPQIGNFQNSGLFDGSDIGYQTGQSGSNNTYNQQHNLEDTSKQFTQHNSGLQETNNYYQQLRKINNQNTMHQNTTTIQSHKSHQNPRIKSTNHQGQNNQQQWQEDSGNYQQNISQHNQPPHNIKYDMNSFTQMQTNQTEESISDFSSLPYNSSKNPKKPEQILENNKELFNYKNKQKNSFINRINNLTNNFNLKNQSQERQQQVIQEQQKQQQWIQKDHKKQADEIFKEPMKPNQYNNPYHFQNNEIIFKSPIDPYVQNMQMAQQQRQQQIQKQSSDDQLKVDEQQEKINQKLARNRESSKISRKRKKVYVESLLAQVTDLSEELEKTKRVLEINNQQLNKLSFENQTLNNFIFGRQQLYEKIEKALQQQEGEAQINLLLDQFRLLKYKRKYVFYQQQFRLGAAGKERINAVNQYFQQILDICIPTHYRYLLWSSQQDLFNEEGTDNDQRTPWRQELIDTIQLSDFQKKQMQMFKIHFAAEKQNLDQLIENLQSIKKQIQSKTQNVENIIDDMRNVFNPIQNAKFLLFLEKNKYRREISNSDFWRAFNKEGGEYDFDEEGQSDQTLLNAHILEQNINLQHSNDIREGNTQYIQQQQFGYNTNIMNHFNRNEINQISNDNEYDETQDKPINQEGPRKRFQIQTNPLNYYG